MSSLGEERAGFPSPLLSTVEEALHTQWHCDEAVRDLHSSAATAAAIGFVTGWKDNALPVACLLTVSHRSLILIWHLKGHQ